MANKKNESVVTDKTTTEISPVSTPVIAPVELAPAPAPVPVPVTRETLTANVDKCTADMQTAIATGNFIEVAKISAKLQDAIKAVNQFDAKIKADELAAENEQKKSASFDFIAHKLNVSRETVEALVTADMADPNTPLRQALTAIFGGKITTAKEGQSGTSLQAKSGDGAKSGKSSDILEYLKTGTATRAGMLERYPTAGNPDKINGTARTVISAGGWKINDAGVYAI